MAFGLERIQGIVIAKTPIMHGGNEKTGSTIMLNRRKFIVNGKPVDVPIISGNAVRGYLRRLFMKDFLNQIGYEIDYSKKGGVRLHHALFSGGLLESLDSSKSGVIDINFKKKVVKYLIPATIFGFSFGNQMIESKLKPMMLLPICRELKGTYIPEDIELPEWYNPNVSFYELIDTPFQTRKDELRMERERGEQAVQMIIDYEAFVAGTVFYHEFRLEDPEPIELSAMARILELWKMKPFIGAKSSIGFGEVEIRYKFDKTSEEYLNFLQKNKDEIVAILDELQEVV
ncbi:hypothetical protein ACO3UB_08330 (plasmid) [Methanocaldococcus sp. 16A]